MLTKTESSLKTQWWSPPGRMHFMGVLISTAIVSALGLLLPPFDAFMALNALHNHVPSEFPF